MKPNTDFKLTVEDIALIEHLLHSKVKECTMLKTEEPEKDIDNEVKQVVNLLGRLHDQKTWYRPKNKPYVGG